MTHVVLENWPLAVLCLAALLVLWFAFVHSKEGPVARRVFSQFLFHIALPLMVLLGAPLVVLAAYADLDASLWPAFIAGLVISAGWLTSAIFGALGKSRDKAEKLRDYHKALYAEIGNGLQMLWANGQAEEEAARLKAKMEADPAFIPLIPREHNDFVYDSVVANIEVLPRVTIDAIVAYYSAVKSVAAQAEDMRGSLFRDKTLAQKRRIQMYEDYFATRKYAFEIGQYTLRVIKEYSDNGQTAAEQLAKKLSNPGAARSDLSQESE